MPKQNKKYIKFCPQCGSTNLTFGDSTQHGSMRDICKDCGYGKFQVGGMEFPSVEEKHFTKLKKEINKKKKV